MRAWPVWAGLFIAMINLAYLGIRGLKLNISNQYIEAMIPQPLPLL